MSTVAALCQIALALGILNVWIVRYGKATPFRPDGAADMREEFRRYGLPEWMTTVVGAAKLGLALLLVVGLFYPGVAAPAAGAMALLMMAAVAAHVRVRDPWVKAVPALAMLVMATVVWVGRP
jgi:hypothetical protein